MIDNRIEKIRAEIGRRYNEYMEKDSELAAIRADECLGILSYIDSMQDECNLEGIEKDVAEGFVNRINRKRIPISLKGEMKAKFKNEFNTIWQLVGEMQFANVAKYIIERICLNFATWGAYNLKDSIGISKEEKDKMDLIQEDGINYDKLNFMLDEVLSKETKETWNERLEEPVSEDLEEAAKNYMRSQNPPIWGLYYGFKAGAQWQKEQMILMTKT